MKHKRLVLRCLIAIIALLAVRICYVAYTFDTQQYVQAVQAELEKSTGLKLQVHGPIHKQFFPTPRLSLSQVTCLKGRKTILTATEVVLQARVSSLFFRPFRLHNADFTNLYVYVDASDTQDYRSWAKLVFDNKEMAFKYLDSISIHNGSVNYKTEKKSYLISQLNGQLLPTKKRTLIHWEGTGTYHNLTYLSSFFLKQADDKTLPWSLSLDADEHKIALDGNLILSEDSPGPQFIGSINVTSQQADELLHAFYPRLPESFKAPLRFSAHFDYANQKWDVTQLVLQIGQAAEQLSFAGSITYQDKEEQPVLLNAEVYVSGSEQMITPLITNTNLSDRELFQWLSNKSPNMQVHLVVENTSWSGLPISHLETDITYRRPDIYVKNLSLQGLLSARGDGIWSVSKEDSALDLALQANISNLSHFVRKYSLPFAPYVDLTHAIPVSIACDFHKSLSQFALYNLQIRLPDQKTIMGEFIRENKGSSVRLDLTKINLSDFIHYFDFKRAATPIQALRKMLAGITQAHIWDAYPLHVELKGNDLTWAQTVIPTAQLNADIERQRIRINQLSVSCPPGISLQDVKGDLQKDSNGQVRIYGMHYQLSAPTLSDLGFKSDTLSLLPSPIQITGILDGTADKLHTNTTLKAQDISILYDGTFSPKAPYHDSTVQVSSPSFEPIAHLLWKRRNPFALLEGQTEISAQIRQDEDNLSLASLHVHIGDLQLDGQADFPQAGTRHLTLSSPQFDMHQLYLNEIKDILHMGLFGPQAWDIHFETPELVAWNGLIVRNANAHLLMQPTQWKLLDMTGFINHGQVQASGQLQKTEDDAALSAKINLQNAHFNNIAVPPFQLQTGMLSVNMQLNNTQVDNGDKVQASGTFAINNATIDNLNLSEFIAQAVRLPLSKQFKKDRPALMKALTNGAFTIPAIKGQFNIAGPTFTIDELDINLPEATIKAQGSGQNKTLFGTLQIVFALPNEQTPPPVSVAFAYGAQPKSEPAFEPFYQFLIQHLATLKRSVLTNERNKRHQILGSERQAQEAKNNKGRAELAQSLWNQVQVSYQKIQKLQAEQTFNETAEQLYQQLENQLEQLELEVQAEMTAAQLSQVQKHTAVCTRLMQDIRRAQEEDPVFFAQQRTQTLVQKAQTLFKSLAPLYAKHPSYQNEHLYLQAQKAISAVNQASEMAQQAEELKIVEEKEQAIKKQLTLLQELEKKMKTISQ